MCDSLKSGLDTFTWIKLVLLNTVQQKDENLLPILYDMTFPWLINISSPLGSDFAQLKYVRYD